MSSPSIDGKAIVNTAYHGAVITGLAIGTAKLAKGIFKVKAPELDLDGSDVIKMVLNNSIGLALRDVLVRMGLPDNIMN